jgi:hypothetical protein
MHLPAPAADFDRQNVDEIGRMLNGPDAGPVTVEKQALLAGRVVRLLGKSRVVQAKAQELPLVVAHDAGHELSDIESRSD